ncbi:MAG: type III glutamate--ammonia ligase, partial [Rhodospirillales bacterium]|nr:type III glutamate--ammonia ligase [Rhodospirillales bacterium]
MAIELAEKAKELRLKYFLISYTDLFGSQRAKLVPACAITGMQKNGAGFAGFATWLDMSPADSDMFALPDPSTLTPLPWKKEVGWLASDIYMNGQKVEQGPRNVLQRVTAQAA